MSAAAFGFEALGRRRFLRLGLSAAGVALAGYGGFRFVAGGAPEVSGLQALSPRGHRTLASVARVLFPVSPILSPQRQARLPAQVDAMLPRLSELVRESFGLALVYLEAGPVLLDRRLQTFSRLPAPAQAEHFRTHWELTDDDLRRGAGAGIRRILSLFVYDDEAAWPALHYPGPVLAAMTIP